MPFIWYLCEVNIILPCHCLGHLLWSSWKKWVLNPGGPTTISSWTHMHPSQKIIVGLRHEPLMYQKAVIPGPAPLHQKWLTWCLGPLGSLGSGDSDLQRQSRTNSNTNSPWFPRQNQMSFQVSKRRLNGGVPFPRIFPCRNMKILEEKMRDSKTYLFWLGQVCFSLEFQIFLQFS